jgi:hypothetical protein
VLPLRELNALPARNASSVTRAMAATIHGSEEAAEGAGRGADAIAGDDVFSDSGKAAVASPQL